MMKIKNQCVINNLKLLVVISTFSVGAMATDYYISPQGNDNNSGTSTNTAWATLDKINTTTFLPGDKVLLESGSVWNGMLHPLGSGSATNPITLGKYGTGARPIINGGNAPSVTIDDGYGPIVGHQTLYLHNQDNWIIENLELTNDPHGNTAEDYVYSNNSNEYRRGMYIVGIDNGTLSNITIRNNYVHHVYGNDKKDSYGSGGIVTASLGKVTPSKFDNLLIEKNHVKMVNRTGIGVNTKWQRRPNLPSGHWQIATYSPQHHLTNVIIRNNYAEDIGGDGIIAQGSATPLIEHNLVSDAQKRSGGYSVALWSWNSDQPLHQFNEVYNTRTTRDGQAFDADAYTDGDIFQYNYSHDNDGGFVLYHGGPAGAADYNRNNIIRYNISQNDNFAIFNFYGRGVTNAKIYNNTIYSSHRVRPIYITEGIESANIENNIFYLLNSLPWSTGYATLNFNNNVIFGKHSVNEPTGVNNLDNDPKLFAAGGGVSGTFNQATHTIAKPNVDAYKLTTNSPALNAGKIIQSNGGRDYWGNAVSSTLAPHIGAYNGLAVDENKNKVVNGGFETGSNNWNVNWNALVANAEQHSGNKSIKLGGSSLGSAEQTISNLKPNTSYTLSAWLKTDDSSTTVVIGAKSFGGSEVMSTSVNTNIYQQRTIIFTTGVNATSAIIYVYKDNGAHYAHGDDVSLVETPLINLVTDPGFESSAVNWNVNWHASVVNGHQHTGEKSIRIGHPNDLGSAEQTIHNLLPNTTYTLSAWLKSENGSANIVVGVKGFGGNETMSSEVNSIGYEQRTITFTTGLNSTSAIIYLYKNSGIGYTYADDISLERQ